MVFLRPPLGTFQAFEASLTAERLDALLATLGHVRPPVARGPTR
jgi:hypothetical protein